MVELVGDTIRNVLVPDRLFLVLPGADAASTILHSLGWEGAIDERSLVQWVEEHGTVFLEREVASEAKRLGFEIRREAGSLMAVPIQAARQIIGVIAVACDDPEAFAADDLDALRAIATQSSIALVNTQLLELLSDGKREWEQTVDAIPQAFCIVDARGNIRRANLAFATIVSLPVTALADRQWHSVVPEAWRDPIARALATAGTGAHFELKMQTRTFTATALSTGDTAKMSAIGQLIAGIAHDLNNPLASVVGFAEYLVDGRSETPPGLVEPLRAIHQEAERASQIVKNLLAFARKQEGDRQPLDVGPVLRSTLLLLRNQLMALKVDAKLSIEEDLPSIPGNANQLQQVVVNIITNAAQAAHRQGQGGTVSIGAERWLDGVAITVHDDGPGIPDAIAERIFEPFFTTKPEGEGTGLGLSICAGIITEHGGKIRLENEGPGATFRVELPGGRRAPGKAKPHAPEAHGLNVLVIDDEPHILHYMRAALEEWGHSVVVAPDGVEGLSVATSQPFDVIITDLRMPRVGGREFFENLSESDPELARHVVFCTGDTVGGDALAFLESVGRPHLKKPFSLVELRTILPAAAAGS
jgi:signal transduction histidine kinase